MVWSGQGRIDKAHPVVELAGSVVAQAVCCLVGPASAALISSAGRGIDLCTLLKHTVVLQHRSFLGLVQTVHEVSASTALTRSAGQAEL